KRMIDLGHLFRGNLIRPLRYWGVFVNTKSALRWLSRSGEHILSLHDRVMHSGSDGDGVDRIVVAKRVRPRSADFSRSINRSLLSREINRRPCVVSINYVLPALVLQYPSITGWAFNLTLSDL